MQPTIKDAIKYARENPESDFARELKVRINSGKGMFTPDAVDTALNELDAEQQAANKPEDGFVDTAIKGIAANPFLRVAETAARFGTGAAGLVKAGGQALMGDTQAAKQSVIDAGKSASEQKINLPYFGAPQAVENPQQAIGVGADIASIIAPVGSAANIVKTGVKGAIKTAAVQGLKTGAVTGASQGFGNAMQQEKTLGGVITDTALGGVVGGATGAVVGSASSALSKIPSNARKYAADKAVRAEQKAFNEAVDITAPKITPALEQQAFNEGRLGKQGLFTGAKITPSAADVKLAEAVQPFIQDGRLSTKLVKSNPAAAKKVIDTEVTRIDQGITTMIADKKLPFNKNQLVTRLNAAKAERIFEDKASENVYNKLITAFVKEVKGKDTLGLFNARKAFDKKLRAEFGSKVFDNSTAISKAWLDVRNAANQYVAEQLPKNNPFRALLKQESYLIQSAENIGTKIKGITQSGKYNQAAKRLLQGSAVVGTPYAAYKAIK